MRGDGFITWMLRSPLHGMLSGTSLLVTVTGEKSLFNQQFGLILL